MSDPEPAEAPKPLEGEILRGAKGRFLRGTAGPPADKRRKRGQPNRINATIREALEAAASSLGGKGGVQAFLEETGKHDPVALATMLIRSCVPPAKEADPEAGGVVEVHIHSIPVGQFLTLNDVPHRLVGEEEARALRPPLPRPDFDPDDGVILSPDATLTPQQRTDDPGPAREGGAEVIAWGGQSRPEQD
jgi:hypothetical protein